MYFSALSRKVQQLSNAKASKFIKFLMDIVFVTHLNVHLMNSRLKINLCNSD